MRNGEKDSREAAIRREKLLETGFRLFAEHSIEAVKLQDVATASGVGIATLYRYFENKPNLVIEIGTKKWNEYHEEVEAEYQRRGGEALTAAENLEFYLDFYMELYKNHKDLLRFNQNFNNYVAHEGISKERLVPYLRAIGNFAEMFHEVYEKGKKDGTIRTGLSEEKFFAVTSHIMLAVAVRYAQGLLYAAENEADRTEEYELLKHLLLREYVV